MSRVIDSHHHLWNFSEAEYDWIRRDMSVLRQDFTPEMLYSELAASGIDGCVAVQARQSLEETDRLLALAKGLPLHKGRYRLVTLTERQRGKGDSIQSRRRTRQTPGGCSTRGRG